MQIHAESAAPAPAYEPTALEDYREVVVRGADKPLASYHLWANGQSPINVYSDEAQGGGIDVGQGGGTRTMTVRTGKGWGCGLTIKALTAVHPDASANALGATRIRAGCGPRSPSSSTSG